MSKQQGNGQGGEGNASFEVVFVDEVQVDADGMVGQPGHGEEDGKDHEHPGHTSPAGHDGVVSLVGWTAL